MSWLLEYMNILVIVLCITAVSGKGWDQLSVLCPIYHPSSWENMLVYPVDKEEISG